MGIMHWIDVPSGTNEAHINPSNFSSSRENGEMTCTDPINGLSSSMAKESKTLASCENITRASDLYAQEHDKCQDSNVAGKKRIVGWGLRKFSMIVCAKVQAKGRTTYNQVADEIVREIGNAHPDFPFDEKNIRRRVYDAINVLMAIRFIEKVKKEIRWVGYPVINKCEKLAELKEMHMKLINRVQAKANFLKELEEKFVDFQNLMLHNQQTHKSGIPSEGIGMPFLLVQTHPQATVEIEISDDMHLAHFDFNGSSFKLHDDAAILKAKRFLRAGGAAWSPSDGSTLITDRRGRLLEPTSFSWNSENLKF